MVNRFHRTRLANVRDARRMNAKLALGLAVVCGPLLVAQVPVQPASGSDPRMITVDGVRVRVWTAGLDGRVTGRPVIVLEAGSGAQIETWQPVFGEFAKIAPVIAYDRLGLGQSDADPKTPTLTRNAETLRDVLHALAPPPYVLVGHSLGGVIIRGFSHLYADETAGMVYLDVPDFEATREERAALLSGDARERALKPPDLPAIPADTPAKLRPLYEQLLAEMRDDFPSARRWKQPVGIPVGVVVTARADRLRGDGAAMVRLHIKHQMEWTLGSPNSLFTIAGHTGHQVHRDDPALVISIVKHVFDRASPRK
jgi:pimeloyl-ACP methyl ester carboxylesterase